MKPILILLGVIMVALVIRGGYNRWTTSARKEAMMQDQVTAKTIEKATFGAGCFWGIESTFRELKGVTSTSVGYCGGKTQNPTYEQVCTDRTGHAESVEVQFDPTKITYDQLLDSFWSSHNPTQTNGQGVDLGTQYRSVIFFHTPEQKAAADASKARLEKSGRFKKPIATQIVPASTFWRAEDYHQQYYERSGSARSCKVTHGDE